MLILDSRHPGLTDQIHTFLTTQGLWGPPWMRDQLNSGPPPTQREHERRYTPFTHPFILTRRIWKDDYDGQMIFGDLVGLKIPYICLTGEEKFRKNLTQETCPDRDRTRARCVTGAHATACSTAVDNNNNNNNVNSSWEKVHYITVFSYWRDRGFRNPVIDISSG